VADASKTKDTEKELEEEGGKQGNERGGEMVSPKPHLVSWFVVIDYLC